MDRRIPKEEQRRRMTLRLLKIVGAVAAAALLAVIVVSMSRATVSEKMLELCTVSRGAIQTSVAASGEVMPAFEEVVNSPIASRIMEVYKQSGDTVARGSALLRLDLEETQNEYYSLLDEKEIRQHQLQQLRLNIATTLDNQRMNIAIAELEFERLSTELRNERYLDSIGSGTADRVRQAELALSTADKRLQQQRTQLANDIRIKESELRIKELDYNIFEKKLDAMRRTLDDARIESPRAATLTYINNVIGARVAAGERIAVIKIVAQISDAMAEYVRIGKRVVVKVGGDELQGVISNASPVSENGVIKFDIALNDSSNPRLRQGLRTDVYIMNEIHDNVLRIYNRSFYIGAGEYKLFVKNAAGELERRDVRLGTGNYNYVEVVDGLLEGDEVVVSDMREYNHNSRIKLVD